MNTRHLIRLWCFLPTSEASQPRRASLSAGFAFLLAGLIFTAGSLHADNILVNPGFEADGNHGGGVPITAWTTPSGSGNWWINSDSYAHSGGNYYKVWGQWNGTTNYSAVWQDQPSLPTSTYQADGWQFTLGSDNVWNGGGCYSWLEVTFRDASDNILALYRSDLFSPTESAFPYTTNVWYDFPITNICEPTPPYTVIGSTNQLVAPPGTVKVRFQQTLFQPIVGGGSVYFDDATLNQTGGPVPPAITQLYPGNMLFASNYISFHVTSASSTPINTSDIHLVVNGVDVSSGCSFTGSSPDIGVLYTGIADNALGYTASITVTDAYAFTASASMSFDTLKPSFVWEAEDYDFTNGLYLNDPILSSTPQSGSYFGTMGVTNVDYTQAANDGPHDYRPNDISGTGNAGDATRQKFLTAQLTDPGVLDYNVGYISTGDWFNYTRDYPTGTFNIYARLSGGSGATKVSLDDVSGGTTNNIGVFSFTGSDWGAYNYIGLVDDNGNLLPFAFDGNRTLRVTLSSGGDNMNFFMLVPAQTGVPFLSNISPTNGAMFASAGSLEFTADCTPVALDNSGIHLSLNGADVSSSLTISGSTSIKNVSCPLLHPNVIYTAVISVTNANGVGISRTLKFDTIDPNNFVVQAEDYDYDGGQYDVANNGLLPNGYIGINTAIDGVDYFHTPGGSDPYLYRAGLPTQQITTDTLLPGYSADYNVGYFNGGDWGNYTRDYPAGTYFVFGRLAGYNQTVYLDKVVSGVGTTNQVTQRLGYWKSNPNGWGNYMWVPLTDSGGAAPVPVTLGGVSTLRLTTGGNCNPNYFMLIPASGITLSATTTGNQVLLSFPTQVGQSYRVFSRTDLNSGSWTLLTTVPGDGTVKSVSDPVGAGHKYYTVTSP